jgi:2-polyprenyl-6-methoxyphenol hydroxylase-like FAD-dependent oxidoreductase
MSDADLLRLDTYQKAKLIRQLTSEWHEDLGGVINAPGAHAYTLRVSTMIPSALPSKRITSPRVVLIGDAAHAMAPTAALGATTALRDTAMFVKHFLQQSSTIASLSLAKEAYVTEMTAYAQLAMEKALVGGKAVFGMRDCDQLPLFEGRAAEDRISSLKSDRCDRTSSFVN